MIQVQNLEAQYERRDGTFAAEQTIPYTSGFEELADNLSRLNLILRNRVKRSRALHDRGNLDGLAGIAISDAEIDAFLDPNACIGTRPDPAFTTKDGFEDREFREQITRDRLRCETRARLARASVADLRLNQLRERCGLSATDIDICLLCLGPEIHPGYGRLYAYLHNDITRTRPTIALALELFGGEWPERIKIRRLLAKSSLLVGDGLIVLAGNGENPLETELLLDSPVTSFLLGAPIEEILEPCSKQAQGLDDLILSNIERDKLEKLRNSLINTSDKPHGPSIAIIRGPDGVGKHSAAAALIRSAGRLPFLFHFNNSEAERLTEFHKWLGQVRILGGWPVVDVSQQSIEGANTQAPGLISAIANSRCQCGFVLSDEDTRFSIDSSLSMRVFTIELKVPPVSSRREAWVRFLREEAVKCKQSDVRATAAIFPFTAGRIRNAARAVAAQLRFENDKCLPAESHLLNKVCRSQCAHKLGQIAELIQTKCSWTDLVLPPDEFTKLREIAGAIRKREHVLERWSFGEKICPRGGVSALFFGPSGTGKTMAASILANELAMEIYRVDLSRIISKYIGETEKNLDGLFEEARRAHAIVFFDEAEAVFGKRSEVKDSHDRYSNIEVAYLLQRIEAFDGVAILATNLRKNMDNAFMRRLQFAVEFPPPSYEQRLRIWRGVWPHAAEISQDLDVEFMARNFEVTGGHIRNIALMAAYLAAQNGEVISMAHLVQATHREFQKLGRLCIDDEFGNYKRFLKQERAA